MVDEHKSSTEQQQFEYAAKRNRIERNKRAQERGQYELKGNVFAIQKVEELRQQRVSDAIKRLELNVPGGNQDMFIDQVIIAVNLLLEERQVNSPISGDIGNLVHKFRDDINRLIETLQSIEKDSHLSYPINTLLSNIVRSWWLDRVKETKDMPDPQLCLQEQLSSFALLQGSVSSVDRLRATLVEFRNQIDDLEDLYKDTSRTAHEEYNFVYSMAEIWCSFFRCKPTLSRNRYLTTTGRRKSAPISLSRLFEPFIKEVVPEPAIGTEIIRSVLESLEPDWGDRVIKWADRSPPNTSDAT